MKKSKWLVLLIMCAFMVHGCGDSNKEEVVAEVEITNVENNKVENSTENEIISEDTNEVQDVEQEDNEVQEKEKVEEKIVFDADDWDYVLQWRAPVEKESYEIVFGFNMPFTEFQEQGYEGFVAGDGTDIFSGYEFLNLNTGDSFRVNIEDDVSIGTLKKFQETSSFDEGDEIFYSYAVRSIEKKDIIETPCGRAEIFLINTSKTMHDGSEIMIVWEVALLMVNRRDIVINYSYATEDAQYGAKLLEMIPQMF